MNDIHPGAESNSLFARAYRVFAYGGLMTVFAAQLHGFRYDPAAPASNYGFNIALYAIYMAMHLLMTRSWYKRAIWGNPAGTPAERRVYITVAIVGWLAVLALHRPVPGSYVWFPEGWTMLAAAFDFAALIGFLWCLLLFFQGATREGLDGLVGVPGSIARYSHGPETPLFVEGPYSEVRHPMYRAAMLAGVCSLVLHPHAGQLLWTALVGTTFIAFIPVEEAQLLA
ncbi:MAG: hypothetical protein AB7U73_19425, partial [Pirellulales bacterium]